MLKFLETLGTYAGICGAVLVATKYPEWGYPFFLLSSVCLLSSAIGLKQPNYIKLQAAFLSVNLIGLFNYA